MQQQLSSGNGHAESVATGEARDARQSSASDRWLLQRALDIAGQPNIALALWDGWQVSGTDAPRATLRISSRSALFKLMLDPEFTFGELYTDGRITVEGDLLVLMEEIYVGIQSVGGSRGLFQKAFERLVAPKAKADSPSKSTRNARAHYDLGNDFYALWLDRDFMQYTCAYYPTADATIEQAQRAKLELVCRKLNLKPGDRVVEAGGGWGGLSKYMAKHHGVEVTSYNVSHEQVAYARERAAEEGLSDKVTYVEDDYRNIEGTYDVFVSVGMLEHVGVEHMGTLGATIDRCLSPHGRGLIHSIGQISPRLLNKWIEAYIFPGAQPPSLAQMTEIFEPRNLVVHDVENLRPHYALTLKAWAERFASEESTVTSMFDESFTRMWRLYLAGSIAAFTVGELQLFQVVFARSQSRALPTTRDHLFDGDLCAAP
jgi:cyclopropane-fatty-acyl-phospholipid synthase